MAKKLKLKILNKKEIDDWLFYHANILNHVCEAVKGLVNGECVNTKWRDRITRDEIGVIYSDGGKKNDHPIIFGGTISWEIVG